MKSLENREIGDYHLDLESLQEAWECNEDDVHVNLTTGYAWHHSEVVAESNIDGTPNYTAIKRWMDRANYWPNVWEINDHRNVSLISIREDGQTTYHGGLV